MADWIFILLGCAFVLTLVVGAGILDVILGPEPERWTPGDEPRWKRDGR